MVVVVSDMWREEMKRSMLLLSALCYISMSQLLFSLSDQLSQTNPRHSVTFVAAVIIFLWAAVSLSHAVYIHSFLFLFSQCCFMISSAG